jgi:murein DD-endopeptidase MepM/ murein hydrolase activator NlpD
MSFALVGVHARNAAAETADKKAIRTARIEAVKLLVGGNELSDIDAYRQAGVKIFHARLYTEEPAHDTEMSAAKFVQVFSPAMQDYIARGVTSFEIHNEPNLTIEGYGVTWHSPQEFAAWFKQAVAGFRARFGRGIRLGFPGLSPGGPGGPRVISDWDFLAGCRDAVTAADFLCVHTYWQSRVEMEDINGGLRFLKEYHEKFPDKPIVISEFSNNGLEDAAEKGKQYAVFYALCAQYSWIEAAYSFILSSPNDEFAKETWRTEEGIIRPVASTVAARTTLPAPSLLRLGWPADSQYVGQITQVYGEAQQFYFDNSLDPATGQHWLHGGHAGIDLHIGTSDGAPIRAALPGTVIRSRFDPTGFGEMVRIQSIVPNVGTVELTYAHLSQRLVQEASPPTFVNQGDVIGLGGHTGTATGTHLHLAMKVTSNANLLDAMKACSGYINPYPYLCWRGQPRTDYERTYLLLPPNKSKAWALSAIQATWDTARLTVGASADDAGIGNLSYRRVIAVNPNEWPGNLKAFFDRTFPGVEYVSVIAVSPANLAVTLTQVPGPAYPPPPPPPRGQPGVGRPYERVYVLMPPQADATWAQAVVEATWEQKQYTLGGSADDAGIGDLAVRKIIAVNPAGWGNSPPLDQAWYDANYPGAQFIEVNAATPQELQQMLAAM